MATLGDLRSSGLGPLQVLLYGAPGTGKTVLAHSFPRPRTLDLDRGVRSVLWAVEAGVIPEPEDWQYETILETTVDAHGYLIKATAFDKATATLDRWLEEADQWDTLIVDSLTALNVYAMNKALESLDKIGYSKSLKKGKSIGLQLTELQDYKGSMSLFEQFIDWIRSLDKHIVCIAHEYEQTNDNGSIIALQPLLAGQLRQRITKSFDEVWAAATEGVRDNIRYITLTKSDSLRIAKSRLGIFSAKEDMLTYQRIEEKLGATTATAT